MRKIAATVGCVALALVFVAIESGCKRPEEKVSQEFIEGKAISVTDRMGERRTFAEVPQRIVSLSPATTELLFAIGAGDEIVGATSNCDYPPEATKVPRVGNGTIEGVSRETILSLNPDLVICKWDSHEPLMALFHRLGIPFIAVGPESLDELFVEARMLGKVTGHSAEARQFVQKMSARRDRLLKRVAKVPPADRPTVFYEVWDDPLMTAGPNSFIGELLSLAGLQNIFSDTDTRFPSVSSEVVVERDPQVILAPSDHSEQVTWQRMAERPGWSAISAIENRRVYLINGDKVSRCGPRLLDALEQIIDTVYPETAPNDANQ